MAPVESVFDDALKEKFNCFCIFCEEIGVAGAPKAFSSSDWARRLAKGNAVLVGSVKNGLNAMPPGGLCLDCTDEDYGRLIRYVSTPK